MQLDLDYTKTQCLSRCEHIISLIHQKMQNHSIRKRKKLPVCPTKVTLKTMLDKYKWITKERQNWKMGRRTVKWGLLEMTQTHSHEL